MKDINIIVAIGRNREIGFENNLLWHIKPDFNYFKKITKGSVVIVGRKTLFSFPGGPLKNRDHIIITRDEDFEYEGVRIARSIEESVEIAQEMTKNNDQKIFVLGGASIYEQFMPIADKLYITHVFDAFEADTFFPEIGEEWLLESSHSARDSIEHKHPHLFAVYSK